MTYTLQQKTISKAPTNVDIADFILQANLSQLTITDHFLNILCTKTYPGIILQSKQIFYDHKFIIIVLMETCKIEVCELVYKDCKYTLIPLSLKYYEKHTKPSEINPITTDIDSIAYYNSSSFFVCYKTHFFVRVSDRILSYFDITKKDESQIINTKDDMNITNYLSFDYLTYFTIPTLAILTDKKIYIYSFENFGNNYSAIKIDEIIVKENAYDVKRLDEGFCYIRIKEEKLFLHEIVIIPMTNMEMSISVEFTKVNCIKAYKNDIYMFCDDGLYRIEVIFMLGCIKKYNVTKVWEKHCDFGEVNEKHIFVGSVANSCYLIQYKKENVEDNGEEPRENSNNMKIKVEQNIKETEMECDKLFGYEQQKIEMKNNDTDNNKRIKNDQKHINVDKIYDDTNTQQKDYNQSCNNKRIDNSQKYINVDKTYDDINTQQKDYNQSCNNKKIDNSQKYINVDKTYDDINTQQKDYNQSCNNLSYKSYDFETETCKDIIHKNSENKKTELVDNAHNNIVESINKIEKNNIAHTITCLEQDLNYMKDSNTDADNNQIYSVAKENIETQKHTDYDDIYQSTENKKNSKEDNARVYDIYGLYEDVNTYKSLDITDKQKYTETQDTLDKQLNEQVKKTKSKQNDDSNKIYGKNKNAEIHNTNKEYKDIYNETKIKLTYIEKIRTEEIKNYSIKAIKKVDETFFAVGNKQIIKIDNFTTFITQESIKLKGFSKMYSQNNTLCLTNERESFFVNFDDELKLQHASKTKQQNIGENEISNVENNFSEFDIESETINFFTYKNVFVQATKKCVIFDKNKIHCENEITRVLASKNYIYVLTTGKCLEIYNLTIKIAQISNIDHFYILGEHIYTLKDSNLTIYNELDLTKNKEGSADSIENHKSIVNSTLNNNSGYANYTDFAMIQTDNVYVILQTNTYLYFYAIIDNKLIFIQSDQIKNISVSLIVLKNRLFVFPDTFIFIARNAVYKHKIQKTFVYISDYYVLYKNNIARYTMKDNIDQNNTFCIEEISNNENNHFIDFDYENKIFAIGSEHNVESNEDEEKLDQNEIIEDNIDLDTDKQLENILINKSRFKISIYSQNFIALDHFDLKCNEYLSDLKFVKLNTNLKTEIISSEFYFTFLVATTSHLKGTKNLTKGRIIVFDIKNIQSQNIDVKNKKLSALADLSINTNVTGFTTIRGNLAICQGTRIMIYKFDRLNGLTAIAFHDMHIITTSISCVKNYIIASDILKGVTFFYFQHRPVKIHKLSISNEIKICHLNSFFVFGNELLILAFDRRNVFLYGYKPWESMSLKGTFLITLGEGDLEEKVIGCGDDFFYSQKNLYVIKKQENVQGTLLRTNKRLKMKNLSEVRLCR